MTKPAIPDVITVVANSYYQPISDLVENLLSKPMSTPGRVGVGAHENGYSASLVVLLLAVLESYISRLRFVRRGEEIEGSLSTPDLLEAYFPDLPNKEDLVEACLVRNVVAHNHIWHLDVSDEDDVSPVTISNPMELGFRTNKHYKDVVDTELRRTRGLGLNISPTNVDRTDVTKAFSVVWKTLRFMSDKSYGDTPLGASSIAFRGKRIKFSDLLKVLVEEASEKAH